MTSNGDNSAKARTAYRSAAGVAVAAGIFSIVVAVLMAAAHFQLAARPSVEMPALERMRADLRQRPDDAALKEEIRALDLLARRAYFTNLNALRTGGVLLLGGVLVAVASLRLMRVLRRKLPDPTHYGPAADPWEGFATARWTVAGAAAVLVAAAAGLALIVARDMRSRPLSSVAEAVAAKPAPAPTGRPPPGPAPVASVSEEDMLTNWPCFRGPGGLGIARATNAPVTWDGKSGSNILWKANVPKSGFNSPVVWGGKVVISGADKAAREVYCYGADSGQLLWRAAVTNTDGPAAELPEVSDDTGYAAPTLATDGRRVFAIFATGDVAAFDWEGRQAWGRNLGLPANRFGHASSLITHGDLLLIQYDSAPGGRALALDAATGKTVWDKVRDNIQNSWCSPILVNRGGRTELVLNSCPRVAGYDPATGAELWSVDYMDGMEVGPSPAYAAGVEETAAISPLLWRE